ncbi:hypothetical protein BLA29_002572, partial [Euroglyphus maynei]
KSFECDSRLINVQLYKPTNDCTNDAENDEEILYFFLDHQLEPFETYQLNLRLRSCYRRSKLIQINGTTNNWNQILNIDQKQKYGSTSQVDQYEFKLSLTWTNSDNIETFDQQLSSLNTQNACCHFTLSDPFDVFTRVHTPTPQRKFLKIQIHGSSRLPSDIELQFQQPKLAVPFLDSNDLNILKPIGMNDEFQRQKLMASTEINFVWSLDDGQFKWNLKKMNLELQFKPKYKMDDDDDGDDVSTVKIPYLISIQYDCRTRYTIRQWIEPLIRNQTGNKNSASEIIRIGHSCLLRIRIERLYYNDNDADDEFIMYELICDPQLWQFVAATTSAQQSEDSNNNNIEENFIDSNGPTSINSHQSSIMINDGSRVIKFNGQSPNIVDDNDESKSFETAFEVIPLIDGYIPLPLVRLSQYRIITNGTNSGRTTPTMNNRNTAAMNIDSSTNSNNILQKTTSNAIESLSAILSENLSLSGKNWSKYLTTSSSNSSTQQEQQRNLVVENNEQQQSLSLNSIQSLRNARLLPFDPGNVYNYNRSSQVYVLPSLIIGGGNSNVEN